MKVGQSFQSWGLLFVMLTVLEKVHGGDCASDKQRKPSGTKKLKNKGYKAFLRTMVMNDGLPDTKANPDKNAGRRLMKNLFNNYNNNIRPVNKPDETVKVGFGVSVIEILDLNTRNGHTEVHTWVKMTWKDANLEWEPSQYDGMKDVHVPAKMLWLPDIFMFNNAESKNPISKDVNAIVSHDGTVTWVAPATFRMTCRHEFRGNSWSCPMRFASWTYNGFQLDLVPFEGIADIDTSEFLMSDYFSLLYHKGSREVRTFPDHEDIPYPAMDYLLKLRNKIGPSLLGK